MVTRLNGLFIVKLVGMLALAACLESFPFYQLQIPNGSQIPHPCDRSVIWQGVGHENQSGTGPRNPFGLDFAAAGHKWTQSLCRLDSDGDGRTNGQELGDPDCTWNMVSRPAVTDPAQLSHPGICEPITSPKCRSKNYFLTKNQLCRQALQQEEISRPERDHDTETVKTSQAENSTAVQEKVQIKELEQSTTPSLIESFPTAASVPLPAEVVVYEGPLEEVLEEEEMGEYDEEEVDTTQEPAMLTGPKPVLFHTVTVMAENYSQAVHVPLPMFENLKIEREEVALTPVEESQVQPTATESVPQETEQPMMEEFQQFEEELTPEEQNLLPPMVPPPFHGGVQTYKTVTMTTGNFTQNLQIPLVGVDENELEEEGQMEEGEPPFPIPEISLPPGMPPQTRMEVFRLPTVYRTVTEANSGQPLFRYRYDPVALLQQELLPQQQMFPQSSFYPPPRIAPYQWTRNRSPNCNGNHQILVVLSAIALTVRRGN